MRHPAAGSARLPDAAFTCMQPVSMGPDVLTATHVVLAVKISSVMQRSLLLPAPAQIARIQPAKQLERPCGAPCRHRQRCQRIHAAAVISPSIAVREAAVDAGSRHA